MEFGKFFAGLLLKKRGKGEKEHKSHPPNPQPFELVGVSVACSTQSWEFPPPKPVLGISRCLLKVVTSVLILKCIVVYLVLLNSLPQWCYLK